MNERAIYCAMLLTHGTHSDVKEWCADRATTWSRPPMRAVTGLLVVTRDGPKEAPYGSWVVGRQDGTFDVLTAAQLAKEVTRDVSE